MLVSLRRSYAMLVTSGAQLLLLIVGFQLGTRTGWLTSLGLMAAISLATWLSALKRLRAVRDTPTSKVESAAQGYVELNGRGAAFGDTPLYSKLKLRTCLWYRYKIEQRDSEKDWETEDSGESFDSFLLRDESGVCVIDPEQAEISTRHRECWTIDDHRYTEWTLDLEDKLYVIGEFRTKNCALEFDSRIELNELLAEWKKDMPALHRRFDLNNDGELDEQEWALARQAAKRVVAKNQREITANADMHLIGRPPDGKPYLISNLAPEKLSQRYLLWSWAHLAMLLGALGGLVWVIQTAEM
jgi:hypothetical protein